MLMKPSDAKLNIDIVRDDLAWNHYHFSHGRFERKPFEDIKKDIDDDFQRVVAVCNFLLDENKPGFMNRLFEIRNIAMDIRRDLENSPYSHLLKKPYGEGETVRKIYFMCKEIASVIEDTAKDLDIEIKVLSTMNNCGGTVTNNQFEPLKQDSQNSNKSQKTIDELFPDELNANDEIEIFKKAINKGFIRINEKGDGLEWIQIGDKGKGFQLAYFCGKVYGYHWNKQTESNDGLHPNWGELQKLFVTTNMSNSIQGVYKGRKKKQSWKNVIDKFFEKYFPNLKYQDMKTKSSHFLRLAESHKGQLGLLKITKKKTHRHYIIRLNIKFAIPKLISGLCRKKRFFPLHGGGIGNDRAVTNKTEDT